MTTSVRRIPVLSMLILVAGTVMSIRAADDRGNGLDVSAFELRSRHATYLALLPEIERALAAENLERAERLCRQATRHLPFDPAGHLLLGRVLCRQGQVDAALSSLQEAARLGFADGNLVDQHPDFERLRERAEYAELRRAIGARANRGSPGWNQRVTPIAVSDGQALVSATNTAYDPRQRLLLALFVPPRMTEDAAQLPGEQPVVLEHGTAGELLRRWYSEGTAAGNIGDLYDNHDRGHSRLDLRQFPQVTRIVYDEQVRQLGLNNGLQDQFLYNLVTFGNSSTAITSGTYWRSQPRLAYVDASRAANLYRQYISNHLYIYPEHRDHDPGHNGRSRGYGDLYPANTPYLLITQGSSGSDKPFLDAVACTLAAFRPEVKRALVARRALMPTMQMILRRSSQQVGEEADYLTGLAHPSVFSASDLDVETMVRMAHELQADTLPPLVAVRVVYEDEAVPGRDYFENRSERLFDTPSAIARVVRSMDYERRMIVTADLSHDLNGRPLTWHWSVLRGDPERIRITPLNDDRSKAEIVVPYHSRRRIRDGTSLTSNRVDIGVFVHNGAYYSAPAFITFYSLDNEHRTYNDRQLIESVRYNNFYVDPLIASPKDWFDQYQYDEQDRLVRLVRLQNGRQTVFDVDENGIHSRNASPDGRASGR